MPQELPIPPHFQPGRVGEVWKVDYQQRAADAEEWADRHGLGPADSDTFRICLAAVDVPMEEEEAPPTRRDIKRLPENVEAKIRRRLRKLQE